MLDLLSGHILHFSLDELEEKRIGIGPKVRLEWSNICKIWKYTRRDRLVWLYISGAGIACLTLAHLQQYTLGQHCRDRFIRLLYTRVLGVLGVDEGPDTACERASYGQILKKGKVRKVLRYPYLARLKGRNTKGK